MCLPERKAGNAPGNGVAILHVEANELNAGHGQGRRDRHCEEGGQAFHPVLPPRGQKLRGGQGEQAVVARRDGRAGESDPEGKMLHRRGSAGDPGSEDFAVQQVGHRQQGDYRQNCRGEDVLHAAEQRCGMRGGGSRWSRTLPIVLPHLVLPLLGLLVLGGEPQDLIEELGHAAALPQRRIGRLRFAAPQGQGFGVQRDDVQACASRRACAPASW